MNFVGKIFVVMIMVMSFVFMAFAIAVYGTHQNWKQEAAKQKSLVEVARGELEKATAEKERLEAELKTELDARGQALAKLETEKKELEAQRADAIKERDGLLAKDKEAVAALDTAQKNLARLTAEVEGLRGEIRDAQGERDKHFERVVELTDQIHQAQGEVRRLQERRVQLAAQLASAKTVLDRVGMTPETPLDNMPPQLRGKVLAVGRENMIEVSLGTDDGLRVGNTLEVFRGSKYLGRVEVTHAESDRAVGKIIPGFRKAPIQKDDDVATRLKVG